MYHALLPNQTLYNLHYPSFPSVVVGELVEMFCLSGGPIFQSLRAESAGYGANELGFCIYIQIIHPLVIHAWTRILQTVVR